MGVSTRHRALVLERECSDVLRVTDYPVFPPPPGGRPAGSRAQQPRSSEPGTGPAWEVDPQLSSWFVTAGEVLLSPRLAFGRMRRTGGIGRPFLYCVLGLGVGMAGTALWRVGLMSGRGRFELMSLPATVFAVLLALVLAFLAVVVVMVIYAALVHLVLALLGKARHGFEATFRTIAYAYGSAAPAGLVPCAGSTIGVVWAIVVAIPGLSEMQETDTGSAALAVLTPAVLCCGLMVVIFVLTIGSALANLH